MEQPEVDRDVVGSTERSKVQRIRDFEFRPDPAPERLVAGSCDGRRGKVDAEDLLAPRRHMQRVLAGAAPDVDDGAGDQPLIGEAHQHGLRPPDVPWCLSIQIRPFEAHQPTIPRPVEGPRVCLKPFRRRIRRPI